MLPTLEAPRDLAAAATTVDRSLLSLPQKRSHSRRRIKRLLIGVIISWEVLQPLGVEAQNHNNISLAYPVIEQVIQQALRYINDLQRKLPAADDSLPVRNALESAVTVHVRATRSFKRIFPGARGLDVSGAYQIFAEIDPNRSTGSGFLTDTPIASQRYVLTTAHTIARAADSIASIWIETFDGRYLPATLKFADSFHDLAILSVSSQDVAGLAGIPFRQSPPRLTERVYTIGTPFGRYPCSISEGIVSGFDRFFSDETGRFGYVQLTAPAVSGNSGGPAIDRQGRLIGMVTKVGQDLRANGIPHLTFALEGHHCERLLHDYLHDGAVRRPWLGATFAEISPLDSAWHAPLPPIVRIQQIYPGQAFDRAVVGWCDLTHAQVLAINDIPVTSLDVLYQAIEAISSATTADFDLLKEGDTCHLQVFTDIMTDSVLIDIANHFIADHTETLAGELQAGQPVELAVRVSRMGQACHWEKYRVIAAGFNTMDRGHLWEVMTPEELGAIIRLFAIHGKIQLVLVPANATKFSSGDIEYHTFRYAQDSEKLLYH